MPLQIEMLYNEYSRSRPSRSPRCSPLLGLVTLALKSFLEWRYADQLAARHRR